MAQPSAYKNKQGQTLWRGDVFDGKGRRHRQRGFKTKTEAKNWQSSIRARFIEKRKVVGKCPKLVDYLDEWMENKQYDDIGESQVIRIRQHMSHVIAHLGQLRLDEIKPLNVQKLRKALSNRLAPRTIRQMETHLKASLEATVGPRQDDYLEYNPLSSDRFKLMKVNKGDEREIEFFEIDEQKILIAEARKYADEHLFGGATDQRWFMRPFLALKLGLRSGEITGLQWGDIDWSKKKVKIIRAVHYARGDTKPQIKDTKTGKPRTLELSEPVIKELKKYRAWVNEILLKFGERLKDTDHILFSDDFGILHESAPMSRWKTILRRAGLKSRGFHSLRHTYVANLLSLNVNLKHIQYRLGHSTIKTTMDTYGKILEKDKDEVARRIEQWDLQMES